MGFTCSIDMKRFIWGLGILTHCILFLSQVHGYPADFLSRPAALFEREVRSNQDMQGSLYLCLLCTRNPLLCDPSKVCFIPYTGDGQEIFPG